MIWNREPTNPHERATMSDSLDSLTINYQDCHETQRSVASCNLLPPREQNQIMRVIFGCRYVKYETTLSHVTVNTIIWANVSPFLSVCRELNKHQRPSFPSPGFPSHTSEKQFSFISLASIQTFILCQFNFKSHRVPFHLAVELMWPYLPPASLHRGGRKWALALKGG